LLNFASAHPRFANAPSVTLDVWEKNLRAIALYRRHGFITVGKRDFIVGSRILGTDLVMRRAASARAKPAPAPSPFRL
jgi:ribosomal protein S18 acetylase RimI-like enzyme